MKKAHEKELPKIVLPELSVPEKALLMQTTHTPGWKVVVKLANALCAKFTEDMLRLDPESEDYERVCVERQRRARIASEFSDQLMSAIHSHAEAVRLVAKKEEEEAVESVENMFGIHSRKELTGPEKAIHNIFGIHPAKPKKKATPPEGKK